MSEYPKFQQERERLLSQLEEQKKLIHDDIQALKQAAKPIAVAQEVIVQAADSFRDNTIATQTTRLALTAMARRVPHPVVGIAAQIAVPLLLNNFPQIVVFLQKKIAHLSKAETWEAAKKRVKQWIRSNQKPVQIHEEEEQEQVW